eukprot:gene13933-biopygen5068
MQGGANSKVPRSEDFKKGFNAGGVNSKPRAPSIPDPFERSPATACCSPSRPLAPAVQQELEWALRIPALCPPRASPPPHVAPVPVNVGTRHLLLATCMSRGQVAQCTLSWPPYAARLLVSPPRASRKRKRNGVGAGGH